MGVQLSDLQARSKAEAKNCSAFHVWHPPPTAAVLQKSLYLGLYNQEYASTCSSKSHDYTHGLCRNPCIRACTNKNMHRHVLQNPITTLTYTLKKKKGFAVEKLQTDYLNGCTNENCMMRCNASLGMFTAEESPEYSIYYMLRMVSITHKWTNKLPWRRRGFDHIPTCRTRLGSSTCSRPQIKNLCLFACKVSSHSHFLQQPPCYMTV